MTLVSSASDQRRVHRLCGAVHGQSGTLGVIPLQERSRGHCLGSGGREEANCWPVILEQRSSPPKPCQHPLLGKASFGQINSCSAPSDSFPLLHRGLPSLRSGTDHICDTQHAIQSQAQ